MTPDDTEGSTTLLSIRILGRHIMTAPVPELPALADDGSMLGRKFGREVANYFSGSPLNRVSFLRTDHAFLQTAFSHPAARFLLLHDLNPLVEGNSATFAYVKNEVVLHELAYDHVCSLCAEHRHRRWLFCDEQSTALICVSLETYFDATALDLDNRG